MIRSIKAALVLVCCWCLAVQAPAQVNWKGSGGWGAGSGYTRIYDPKTVETVTGEVLSLDEIVPVKGMARGLAAMVRTNAGQRLTVHLGPLWFLEFQDVRINRGSRVVVSGSRVTMDGRPVIIAELVIIDGKEMLRLRDDAGRPVWNATQK